MHCWAVRFCSMCVINCVDKEKMCISKETKQLNCAAHQNRALKLIKKHIDETHLASGGKDD